MSQDESREVSLSELKGRHVVIGVPSHTGKTPIEWNGQLVALARTMETNGARLDMQTANKCGHVHWARDALVTWFLGIPDATDLLFIDHDIKWTEMDVLRLLLLGGGADSGKDVVCGFYGSKEDRPHLFATFDLDDDGQPVVCQDSGLYRLRRAATGFMLIKRHVLAALAEPARKYRHERDPEVVHAELFGTTIDADGWAITEDYAFCDNARSAGFSIWGDHGVRLAHVGDKDYLPPLPPIKD